MKRRFSSLCFNSIKTPQSSAVSSENAVMNPREVARAARRSIDIACERVRLGEALLVFAEGTRSRTHGMQQTLTAVTRYFDSEVWLLPMGITGTERLFPVGDETIHPSRIVVHAGPPIAAAELREQAGGDRRLIMDTLGLAIAGLLPDPYRGVYGNGVADFARARQLMATLGTTSAQSAVGER
jgi:1-acyl-sn-glycerol-3-phosphate acyltransferase